MIIQATDVEGKIPDVTSLSSKAALNAKAKEIKNKIPNITNLDLKAALNTKAIKIEEKIPVRTIFLNKARAYFIIKDRDSSDHK